MERIKGANGELMKYSMQPMDGKGHLTLYRYEQLAVGGADNAHLEFWIEIEELRKQLADAQATIAALQARLEAHERAYQEGHPTPCTLGSYCPYCEIERRVAQLTQRTAERDTARRRVNELEAREVDVVLLREDLEQRTAELEAANHSAQTFQTLWRESCNQRDDLQAELERVRADIKALDKWRADVTMALQRPEGAFFVDVPQHIKDLVAELEAAKAIQAIDMKNNNAYREQVANLQAELERVSLLSSHNERRFEEVDKKYKELRTLLLTLPKVEGEIRLIHADDGDWHVVDLYDAIFTEKSWAESYAALLQHRQGMEG